MVSFSNRMFPTKAVWVWQRASEPQRVDLVKQYFADSGIFEDVDRIERHIDAGFADPVYAVIGIRGVIQLLELSGLENPPAP